MATRTQDDSGRGGHSSQWRSRCKAGIFLKEFKSILIAYQAPTLYTQCSVLTKHL